MGRAPAGDGDGRTDEIDAVRADDREARVRGILRRIYDDVLVEPVPDSFADLLRKLD